MILKNLENEIQDHDCSAAGDVRGVAGSNLHPGEVQYTLTGQKHLTQ